MTKQRAWWWPFVGAVIGGVAGIAIGMALAGDDVNRVGDWRNGAARFVGMTGAIGLFAGYAIAQQLARGKRVNRDGFTLAYRPIAPTAEGYRENKLVTVGDVLAGLAKAGFEPRAEACDQFGERKGSIDDTTVLPGANVAISDPRVRGWIRVALAPSNEDQPRSLGLVEIWSERGGSAEELGLFTLRVLDGLVVELTATRESSALGLDPIPLLTAGLAERPIRRAR